MRQISMLLLLAVSLVAAGDPWTESDLLRPEVVAKDIRTPLLLHVGFDVLYRASHIPGSVYAGPGSKPEGIALLKEAVKAQPKDREIVIYCGCCPMEKCPNIRPAFAALHDMGFTRVKVIAIPENLKADWTDKGYPIEKRSGQ